MSEKAITASWTEWQGMVVDGTFYLDRYLGGTERSAVYLTDWGEPKSKPAAIKLIAADAESADLHLSRWKLVSGLSHPNLLRVYQSGLCELDGLKLLYVVMEYAEENLSEILGQRPLTVEEARETFSGVLEALAALHHQGLVHGQLKPANIMAIGDQLKISSDSIGNEASGTVYPSHYSAPEAANGTLSPATDIWSFGMTLVEALTQQLPSGKCGSDGELELPDLPAAFLEIAQHCLTQDASRRWTIAGIRAHLLPKQAQAPKLAERQLPMEQPEEVAQLAQTALTSNGTKSKAPQPLPIEEETKARSLLEICKPYVPVTLAAGLLLAFAGAVLTMGSAQSPQSREAASISSAPVAPAAASAGAALPAASGSTGAPGVQTPEAISTAETAGGSLPASQDSASQASSQATQQTTQQAPEGVSRPDSMSASLSNVSVSGPLVPGTASERPVPNVPLRARRTIHGRVKIKVKVAVDPSGSVAGATLDSRASSRYFAGIAMDTARRWRFSPAQMNGQNVASEWILKFEFGRSRTKISPLAIVAADQRL